MAVKRYAGDRYTGLSTDTKPTDILDGATFLETDTGNAYFFTGTTWQLESASVEWGAITGTLSNQTDLQAALDTKPTKTAAEVVTGQWDFEALVDFRNGGYARFYDINNPARYAKLAHDANMFSVQTFGMGATTIGLIAINNSGSQVWLWGYSQVTLQTTSGDILLSPGGSGQAKVHNNRILTVADEGSGNGLDADTLDGEHASAFLKTNANVVDVGSFTGTTVVSTSDSGTVYYARPALGATRTFQLNSASIGTQIVVFRNGFGIVNFVQGSNQTILSSKGSSPIIKTNKTMATAVCVATNTWAVSGDLDT